MRPQPPSSHLDLCHRVWYVTSTANMCCPVSSNLLWILQRAQPEQRNHHLVVWSMPMKQPTLRQTSLLRHLHHGFWWQSNRQQWKNTDHMLWNTCIIIITSSSSHHHHQHQNQHQYQHEHRQSSLYRCYTRPPNPRPPHSTFIVWYVIQQRTPCTTLQRLIPSLRYCVVEDGVYNNSYSLLMKLCFMGHLRLLNVVSVASERDGQTMVELTDFCVAHCLRNLYWQVFKGEYGFWNQGQTVASIIAQLIDLANHQLFIHYIHGAHNTGILVICLRWLKN